MSRLPRHIRLQAAAREMGDVIEQHSIGAELDAGFDGGEFSGPAHAKMLERDLFGVAVRFRVPFEPAYHNLMFSYENARPERWPGEHDGDDPPRPFSPTGFAA